MRGRSEFARVEGGAFLLQHATADFLPTTPDVWRENSPFPIATVMGEPRTNESRSGSHRDAIGRPSDSHCESQQHAMMEPCVDTDRYPPVAREQRHGSTAWHRACRPNPEYRTTGSRRRRNRAWHRSRATDTSGDDTQAVAGVREADRLAAHRESRTRSCRRSGPPSRTASMPGPLPPASP
jgi:hypothetical protein